MEIIVLLVLLPLFFLPIIIAVKKNHPHRIPIILVNIFGGLFFGVGWLIALIWCFIEPSKTQSTSNSAAAELEKLYDLKEKGAYPKKNMIQGRRHYWMTLDKNSHLRLEFKSDSQKKEVLAPPFLMVGIERYRCIDIIVDMC